MSAEPISYPGNPSLPREVRDKILSTFRHTLNLYKEGKADDCVIGCDFILKMDPRFAPARQLMEKAKNPAAGVDVGALEAIVAATPTRQERVASVDTDRLLVRAAESLNARDFDAAIATAEQVLKVLPGNQDAGAILEQARQRKNAQPQFEATRRRAMSALDGGRTAEARAALDKMRLLDPEHPAVALLERRISTSPAPAAAEVGESTNPGLKLGEIPDMAPPDAGPVEPAPDGLDHLSLDSLSLDEPSAAYVPPPRNLGEPVTGPLSLGSDAPADHFGSAPEPGSPPDFWSEAPSEESSGSGYGLSGFEEPAAEPAPEPHFSASAPVAAPEPSPQQEVESLLARGDDAARLGNRQQAIEIWSRIFLIDINNSEAVGRIEAARKEMADGNRRVAESLRRGREKFEAGDFTAAREAFLEVLALDESDATARSFLDRIEQELSRPSAGLDLSRKTPASDILAEEMAKAAEPLAEEPVAVAAKSPAAAKAPRRPMDRRFLIALGGALVLAVAVGAFFMMRSGGSKAAPAPAGDGPSLEHATALFREGKLAETVAELRQISPGHPDYARAQKLLASLTRKAGEQAPGAAGAEGAPGETAASAPAATGPPPETVRQREEAEKALNEKRYIDALKSFNLAAHAYGQDPTFTSLMASASEKVSELTPAVKLYNEGEYETAIPILWRIFQADRANQDARSYLLRSYYNQGIAQLQNGLYAKAAESFGEVIAVDPNDTASVRHKKFAERYGKGDLDLMGRIYVRHIQQRP
jgi:tetratricopeptide (TPR) repeat protein